VTVQGNIRPSIRIQADLSRLANYGIALDDLRNVILAANVAGPKGSLAGAASVLYHRRQRPDHRRRPYRNMIVTYRNGAPVLLKDVADVIDDLENANVVGFYQGMPAIVVDIQRQLGAHRDGSAHQERAAETAARNAGRRDAHCGARRHRPQRGAGHHYRAHFTAHHSRHYPRRRRAAALDHRDIRHYVVLRFSLHNFSLMALTIGTGFVVDDAIVMNRERRAPSKPR
jgi:multidrug efflux pump